MQNRSSKICLNFIFYVQARNCIFVKTGFHSSISCQKRRWPSLILLEWIWFSLILESYELNWAFKCLKYVQSYGAEVEYVFLFLHCEGLKKAEHMLLWDEFCESQRRRRESNSGRTDYETDAIRAWLRRKRWDREMWHVIGLGMEAKDESIHIKSLSDITKSVYNI